MRYGHLSKEQANDVYRAVLEAGLDPALFEWGLSANFSGRGDYEDAVPALRLKGNDQVFIAFALGLSAEEYRSMHLKPRGVAFRGPHCIRYAPGVHEPITTQYQWSWEDSLSEVRKWLQNVKKDFAEPDFWQELLGTPQTLSTVPDAENDTFTPNEVRLVSAQLDLLLARVREDRILGEAEYEDLVNRIEYVRTAGNRLGRKDWYMTFVGSLVGFALEHALTSDSAKSLLAIAAEAINALVAHGHWLRP